MTGGQLQVTVEVACRTDRMQVLTTIGWAARLDACSRRLLTDALRTAAQPDPAARAPLFAALARDLFRHAVHTLPPNPGKRTRRHRAASPARHRPPGGAIAALGIYLEHALQPLEPHISRDAVRAFTLETRRELDDLTACRTAGVYVEDLTVTECGDKSTSLEVEGSLGVAV